MQTLRTPEGRFTELPGSDPEDHEPRYAQVPDGEDGELRIADAEAGPADGAPVRLPHGGPTWSFPHRWMIPVLVDLGPRSAGYVAEYAAADVAGFGGGGFARGEG